MKAKTPLDGKNAGWEKNAQSESPSLAIGHVLANTPVRPSTGTADQKESMQLQFARMEGLWPAEEDLPGFRTKAESIMRQVQQ